jgi:hypothetical protein
MTTFTTEDHKNASPSHIVDSGASHQTLGDFIAHKKMVNDLLEEINGLKARIAELERKHKEEFDYAEKLLQEREFGGTSK